MGFKEFMETLFFGDRGQRDAIHRRKLEQRLDRIEAHLGELSAELAQIKMEHLVTEKNE